MSLPSLPDETVKQLELLSDQLDELKTYLLSPELFWPLGGRIAESSRLTLGNLLFTLHALEARSLQMDTSLQMRLTKYESSWESAQIKWATAISKKALQEMGARANLWRGYLGDLSEGLGSRLHYATEVRNRVLFELLLPLPAQDEQYEHLLAAMRSLDTRFASMSAPGPFVWDAAYAAAFPKEQFEALYREPLLPA
jgi:hypothetical protein